jgi:hypothetical protein
MVDRPSSREVLPVACDDTWLQRAVGELLRASGRAALEPTLAELTELQEVCTSVGAHRTAAAIELYLRERVHGAPQPRSRAQRAVERG